MNPIENLTQLDPDLANRMQAVVSNQSTVDTRQLQDIVDTILWSINIEIDLGYAVFNGFEKLIPSQNIHFLKKYQNSIKQYTTLGTSQGTMIAQLLPGVFLSSDAELIDQYFKTFDFLNRIGLYILHGPMMAFGKVLANGDQAGALKMLYLYRAAFSKKLNFHQAKDLTQYLPRLCESLRLEKRAFQIQELIRVAKISIQWIYACEAGFQKGLQLLDHQGLSQFIQTGIQKYQSIPEKGVLYFALDTELSRNQYDQLFSFFPLNRIQGHLNQYLQARIGPFVHVKPLSQLPKKYQTNSFRIFNDGQCIYLPDEMDYDSDKNENRLLFKYLVRWEAAHIDNGTFDFDIEKLTDKYPQISSQIISSQKTDFNQLLACFDNKNLAQNLFQLFEHTRIRFCLERQYPGIVRSVLPIFQKYQKTSCQTFMQALYNRLALKMMTCLPDRNLEIFNPIMHQVNQLFASEYATVETSVYLIFQFYDQLANLSEMGDFQTPFNRQFCFDLIYERRSLYHETAHQLYTSLRQNNIKIYKSDIHQQLVAHNGQISVENLHLYIQKSVPNSQQSIQILTQLINSDTSHEFHSEAQASGDIFYYNEWDAEICSYKINHTRVIQQIYSASPNNYYDKTLIMHIGLLRHIRRRFEMIRPEGLKLLRRWQEGDEFDYRQLLAYAIDRKIRKTPSDRLYMRRIKEYRDVSVFLLVDLSRSTANTLPKLNRTVLDIEQDAIVIFCEALRQCGDSFAIAGFSSAGRHSVTFNWIKKMDEPLTMAVKHRIGNLSAFRSTRMGAAVRHVGRLLETVASMIRLVIILSDGFPNDKGYTKAYAIKDTRKAIHEVRSKGVYVHGITVNLSENAQLDDLYGKGNHHVISDVSELPDRLPNIYHRLTKNY